MYNNATFKCYLSKRWQEVSAPGNPLSYAAISSKIDQIVSHISEAAIRENSRWGTVGNQSLEISVIKTWLQTRIMWLSNNLSNYQTCANPSLPPLVISKINYNPGIMQGIEADNLEFIEITNKGGQTVDLTGIYFRELGLTYQFPGNSVLPAGERIFLASNSTSFKQVYGITAFGQYTRNLSDKSEKLVLADAYGNIIDLVHYQDTVPWPVDADAKGYYLEIRISTPITALPRTGPYLPI
ncbi:MAG: hypothetical protein HC905_10785 [Bacteroidales bacterium]|nr:hypothetical protein [Bacteroidales bacterium]